MDPFNPAPPSIRADLAQRLAIMFGLTVADVRIDAHDIARWHGEERDLLESIGTRRALDPAAAAVYLRKLRTELVR